MKISAKTLQILKNFSLINESILVRKGSVLSTVSPNKEILARAKIDETFDREFAIYNLVKFLGTMSLFDDPEVEFETNHLKMINGNQAISFYYTDPSMIVAPPDKDIKLKSEDIKFSVTQSVYVGLMKALHVLQLPTVAVIGDRKTIKLVAMDGEKKTTNDRYEVEVGTTEHEFTMMFSGEHLKLVPGDYDVTISVSGISCFKGKDIQYWIAINGKNSTFTK